MRLASSSTYLPLRIGILLIVRIYVCYILLSQPWLRCQYCNSQRRFRRNTPKVFWRGHRCFINVFAFFSVSPLDSQYFRQRRASAPAFGRRVCGHVGHYSRPTSRANTAHSLTSVCQQTDLIYKIQPVSATWTAVGQRNCWINWTHKASRESEPCFSDNKL